MREGSPFKYLVIYTLPMIVLVSFFSNGWLCFLPLLYIFGFIPLLELITQPDTRNYTDAAENVLLHKKTYDFLVYAALPVQYGLLLVFLFTINEPGLGPLEVTGRITAMGLMCGTFGINVAHELGHRSRPAEQRMAQALLLTSLYMHFFIEHNRGHHRRVSTPEDHSTARFGETVYAFWLRSGISSYFSAWSLERERLAKKGLPALHPQNQMLRFQLIQAAFILLLALLFGLAATVAFVAAAVMGGLLLETVNYIEHYGLMRKELPNGNYERVMPHHSWNSNHPIGRLMLFELSRHSDHHFKASRKYQVLRHHEDSPQMPTGYPGMMVLSLLPPLWFWVMNPRVRKRMPAVSPAA